MIGGKTWSVILVSVAVIAVVAGIIVATSINQSEPTPLPPPPPGQPDCPTRVGPWVYCEVTRVLDGDTLDVEDGRRIRLVLVDAPEPNEIGGPEARDFLTDLCLGTLALIDEDDFQVGDDPFGRILAVVHCEGTNANAAMISSGHAKTYYEFCSVSEFRNEAWTGCASAPPPPPPPPRAICDLAYPDVCIPSPPPDSDCGDIPHRNFRVLPPDPHRFDGDRDGVGCET